MQNRVSMVTLASGVVRRLGETLDRPISSAVWSSDGAGDRLDRH